LILDLNLLQLIETPTHTAGNILDLLLTNNDSIIHNLSVNPELPSALSSDHYIIKFNIISTPINSPKSAKVSSHHNYSKANWDGMFEFLTHYNFSPMYNLTDINLKWQFLKGAISEAISQFVPVSKPKPQHRPKWFNSEIQHKLNCVHTIRRKTKTRPSPHNIAKLEAAEQNLSSIIENAKHSYETSLIQNFPTTKSSEIFKYISAIKSNDQIPSCMQLDSSTATTDEDKAKLLNHYFFSVYTHTSYQLPPIHEVPHTTPTLNCICINEQQVYKALVSLDTSKAAGIDAINPSILKHCATPLTQPLCHLFCYCLTACDIPSEWRIHCITPIFKSGDRSNAANYRPISLLCVVSKILERLIYNYLVTFLTNSFSNQQFGFLAGRSALQQLLLFTNNLLEAKTNSQDIDVLYFDYSKAFDSVPHNELLYKLWKYGITGDLWQWFRAYLSSRMQCVKINQQLSGLLPVVSGVPQGSILGPILFVLYVNDLPHSLSVATPYLFADDTKCMHTINNSLDSSMLQTDVDNLTNYSESWHLKFNVSKCTHLHFHFSSSPCIPKYYIKSNEIPSQSVTKDLGIIFSTDLQWSEHHNKLVSRAYRTLHLLRRTFSTPAVSAKKLLYISLVRSQLTYCSQLWRPHLIKDILTLERVQRHATKHILNDYVSSYKSRLTTLHLLPLMYIYELNDIMFLIKSLKNPSPFFNIYNFVSFVSSSTRSSTSNKLLHHRTTSTLTQNFYFTRITRLWNVLPVIDLTSPISILHNRLKEYFWGHFTSHFDSNDPCSFHVLCPCYRCSSIPQTACHSNLNNELIN